MAPDDRSLARAKPSVTELGVDLAGLEWQRSGTGEGSFEVAFVGEQSGRRVGARAEWVLLRVAGDPAGRVLIYDRVEWACFLDGVRRGEFDLGGDTARPRQAGRPSAGDSTAVRRPGRTFRHDGGVRSHIFQVNHFSNWCTE
jgi:hypothetical protein